MKKVVFSLLSIVLASSVAVVASAKENTENAIKPLVIHYESEPNNTMSTADPIVAINGNEISGALSPDGNDIDYFVFTAASNATYEFSLEYDLSKYKLQMSLLDQDGNELHGANGSNGSTKFSKYLVKGSKYYLEVMGSIIPEGQYFPYSVKIYKK